VAADDTNKNGVSAFPADAVRDKLDDLDVNEQDIAAAVVWARTQASSQTGKRSDEL